MAQPDNELHMNEVRSLAEEARQPLTEEDIASTRDRVSTIAPLGAPRANSAGAVPRESLASIAPIHLGKTHEVVPDRYVLHIHFTVCKNCTAQSTDSQFFALSYLRSRATGTRVRHLQRCDTPLFNLPVERIIVGHHKTPFCAECDVISLSHLPPPPSDAMVHDLPDVRVKGAKPKTPKSPPTPPVKLEDLI